MGGLALLIAVIAIWYFFFTDDCDPNKKGYTKKGKISDKCFDKAEDPKNITTVPPTGCQQWLADNIFPLKRCMSGNKIKALQTALGFTGTAVDGKFGGDTLGAVQNKFGGRSEVTQSEYNALINPSATDGVEFKGVYAKYDNTVVRNKDLSENRKAKKDDWLGTLTDTTPIGSQTYYELDGNYYVIKSFAYLKA